MTYKRHNIELFLALSFCMFLLYTSFAMEYEAPKSFKQPIKHLSCVLTDRTNGYFIHYFFINNHQLSYYTKRGCDDFNMITINDLVTIKAFGSEIVYLSKGGTEIINYDDSIVERKSEINNFRLTAVFLLVFILLYDLRWRKKLKSL